jgi:uncharacterized protein
LARFLIAKIYGALPAKEIVFFIHARHNGFVIGAFLNALGILAGALFGFTQRRPLSAQVQNFFKSALGASAVLLGLYLIWLSVSGTFWSGAKQVFLAALAVVLGNWLGKLLRLQKISNRVGRYAAGLLAAAQKKPPGQPADGLIAATILFCAAPLGIIGAVTDGLSYYFFLLALKAVMDGLAMASFVKIFRWPVVLAAIPVLIFLNGLTFAVHFYAAPFLDSHHLTNSINAASGLIVCATALVIFEVRRVELANYLPALFLAPLITHWWK